MFGSRRTTVAARYVLLVLVACLSLVTTRSFSSLLWVGLIAVAAAIGVVAGWHRVVGTLARLAEVVLTCGAASAAAATVLGRVPQDMAAAVAASAVLPYLAVPVVAATLRGRSGEAAGLLGVAAGILTGVAVTHRWVGDFLTVSGQWMLLSALAAIVASALQRNILAERRPPPQPYAEATRLLTQLRSVARQLPGATLDPGGLAEHLLDELRTAVPVDRGAVLSASGGGRLVVLAQNGPERVDWETDLDVDSAISEAWASQQPQTTARSQGRSAAAAGREVSALVVPLMAGLRTVGLVVLEKDGPAAYPTPVVNLAVMIAAPAAIRLEAALLFDEVRSLATSEERQRLAREIHDGVAQELVMVGYGIDNAMATLPDAEATAEELRTLRGEVTRVITELRLSLFELRSAVDRHGGLAAAISDYARTVGSSAGLRVHLSLDESASRLPAAVEAELLRIAQEAITNARKHAKAENLWVTCAVDPPFAQIEVSDDGRGIVDPRPEGRYGLAIMTERAERIRGRLEIRPREPNGTTVAVVLGTSPRRGSV